MAVGLCGLGRLGVKGLSVDANCVGKVNQCEWGRRGWRWGEESGDGRDGMRWSMERAADE
jgi:hypothetical protein